MLNRPWVMTFIEDAAQGARVIVLTGEGRALCSGPDLPDTKDIAAADFGIVLNEAYMPLLRRTIDAPLPAAPLGCRVRSGLPLRWQRRFVPKGSPRARQLTGA
ncbi:hypothetical protein [Paracoccus sp. IB05]|uniref:hypothetical protein n=1 Tax=Paracoccus sp. IB05 TaxID=2779367 RepID=UPI0018E714D8|nr:hypothetical protein [Paracoccus sp. IB05]MBJ2151242.1 hypothetical protein [Paracoccus sp. IB05]